MKLRMTWDEFVTYAIKAIREEVHVVSEDPQFKRTAYPEPEEDFGEMYIFPDFVEIEVSKKLLYNDDLEPATIKDLVRSIPHDMIDDPINLVKEMTPKH